MNEECAASTIKQQYGKPCFTAKNNGIQNFWSYAPSVEEGRKKGRMRKRWGKRREREEWLNKNIAVFEVSTGYRLPRAEPEGINCFQGNL